MAEEDRVAAIRAGYESLNRRDLAGIVAILTEDVIWPDVVNDAVLEGRNQVHDYFERVFRVAALRVTLGEVIPLGDAIIATTHQQFYELDGKPLGQPRTVVNRFTFRGDLVSRMEVTSADDIPAELRTRYRALQP